MRSDLLKELAKKPALPINFPYHIRPNGILGGVNFTTAAWIELQGTVSKDMRWIIKPLRNVYMSFHYHTIVICNVAAWQNYECAIELHNSDYTATIPDAVGDTVSARNQYSLHSAISWESIHPSATFKLAADTTYNVSCHFIGATGGSSFQFYQHPDFAGGNASIVGLW